MEQALPTVRRKRASIQPGERHGRLTAVRLVSEGRNHRWLFRCDCGNDVVRRSGHVRDGLIKSCGCHWPRHAPIEPGSRYGLLTAISEVDVEGGSRWLFMCDCGNHTTPDPNNVLSGNTASCGCRSGGRTHGRSNSSEYTCWETMIQRCTNPSCPSFRNYGGRGIAVCDRWRAFENFLADLGPRPSMKHSLERIDNDKGYAPGNVVWATRREQQRNRRNTSRVTLHGRQVLLIEACEEAGIHRDTVLGRLKVR